jgi:hypothetical protein
VSGVSNLFLQFFDRILELCWWSDIFCFSFYMKFEEPSWPLSYCSWIYNYLCNQWLLLTLWVRIPLVRGVLDTPLCDKVCQYLAVGLWFSKGTPIFSTKKTDRPDLAEILLKLALNTITITLIHIWSLYLNLSKEATITHYIKLNIHYIIDKRYFPFNNFLRVMVFKPTYSTFLASSQFTTNIHWPRFRTVHVYVVFLSGIKSEFIVCLYLYCRWLFNYQKGIWVLINQLNPSTF